MDALNIILTGALVAASGGLLGSYLILRKMAMVSDAISHAVLPGIVIAFFIAGSAESIFLIFGAAMIGMLATFLIEYFHSKAHLQTDAAIGVTFTMLFAIGVILVNVFAGNVHIDQDCVLYGEIAYVPLDIVITKNGTVIGPKALIILGVVFMIILAFIIIFYKEMMITSFDPAFAATTGYRTMFWHYALMALVSLMTVASFESVGAILVVAFLIVPAATAYLLTHQMHILLVLSVFIGILSAVGGYYLAVWMDGSIAGAMATVSGVLFAIAFTYKRFSISH